VKLNHRFLQLQISAMEAPDYSGWEGQAEGMRAAEGEGHGHAEVIKGTLGGRQVATSDKLGVFFFLRFFFLLPRNN